MKVIIVRYTGDSTNGFVEGFTRTYFENGPNRWYDPANYQNWTEERIRIMWSGGDWDIHTGEIAWTWSTEHATLLEEQAAGRLIRKSEDTSINVDTIEMGS